MNARQYEEALDYIGHDEYEMVYTKMIEDPEMSYEEKSYTIRSSYVLTDEEINTFLYQLDRFYFKDDELW